MKCVETEIDGVLLLRSPVFQDDRGYFQEIYNERVFREAGLDLAWKQDNISVSAARVVRGLHYQLIQPQAKLVRVLQGAVFDVAVDIRPGSSTYGQHVAIELRGGDGQALFIPAGFAHGFAVLEPQTIFLYKVDNYYAPEGDRTIFWNDPTLGIKWPVRVDEAIVSVKDRAGKPFAEALTNEPANTHC